MAGRRTQLGNTHQANGARFIELGDFSIPAVFSSVEEEYRALKETAGLIDRSHECRFKIKGTDREAVLDNLVTRDLRKMDSNEVVHCYICNEQGGIVDDALVLKTDQFYVFHGRSAKRGQVNEWFQAQAGEADVEIQDSTTTQGCIEVRGPAGRTLVEGVVLDGKLPEKHGESTIVQIGQARCLVLHVKHRLTERFLIHAGALYIQPVWERLQSAGHNINAVPVGYAACEVARIEAGEPGYGTEIDPDTTPLDLNATRQVDFSKPSFIGRRALAHQACAEFTRRLVQVRFDVPNSPEAGSRLEFDGMPVGRVTSACRSLALGCGVALGFVDGLKAAPGVCLQVRMRNQLLVGAVVERGSLLTA